MSDLLWSSSESHPRAPRAPRNAVGVVVTRSDLRRLARYFQASLIHGAELDIYVRARLTVVSRTPQPRHQKVTDVTPGSIYVGRYAHGASAGGFIEDVPLTLRER